MRCFFRRIDTELSIYGIVSQEYIPQKCNANTFFLYLHVNGCDVLWGHMISSLHVKMANEAGTEEEQDKNIKTIPSNKQLLQIPKFRTSLSSQWTLARRDFMRLKADACKSQSFFILKCLMLKNITHVLQTNEMKTQPEVCSTCVSR